MVNWVDEISDDFNSLALEIDDIVNFAARVIGVFKGTEIWLSDWAKEDIDRLGAEQHKRLGWKRHDGVAMKGFPGLFTLWSVQTLPG